MECNRQGERRMRVLRKQIPYCLILLILSFVFLLFFSYSSSPLYPNINGSDSSFFRLVGQGMNHGLLPYRDFFDMKGPAFFFVEGLGQFLSETRYGILFLQVINLFLTAVFADRIIRDISNEERWWPRLLTMIPVFVMAALPFEDGNGTEEFSLFPLMLCLSLAVQSIQSRNQEQPFVHKTAYAFIYGLCFGYCALVRINNAALICSIVLTMLVMMVQSRQWIAILKNAGFFLAGLTVAFLPFVIFYASRGLLGEMMHCVFVFGFRYASEDGLSAHLQSILSLWKLCVPMLLPVLGAFLVRTHRKEWVLLSVTGVVATVLACASGNGYSHYFLIGLPLFVLGSSFLLSFILQSPGSKAARILLSLFLLGAVFFSQMDLFHFQAEKLSRLSEQSEEDEYTMELEWYAEEIPEEEKNAVLFHNGMAGDPYFLMDVFLCNRYCLWQEHYVALDPEIEAEIRESTEENPIRWIFTYANCNELPDYYSVPEGYYYEQSNCGGYVNMWCLTENEEMDFEEEGDY